MHSTWLLPWLLLSLVPLCRPCPTHCRCFSRRAEVVCDSTSLDSFPSDSLPKNTTFLTVQFTNITTITETHLNRTPHLQELHLFSNQIQSLGPNLLRGLPKLRTLDLTENKLADLPAKVFSHAPLQSLVLKSNQLKIVSDDWLSENSTLTWLDLSKNRLTEIPAILFRKAPNLDNLDLPNNLLEKIVAKSLDELTKLERLNLQNNKINSLDSTIFQKNLNLTHLFLSRNKLEKLPQNLFVNLTRLRHLYLEENHLQRVVPGLFDSLVSLDEEGLDLSGNPWSCDGKIEYLWSWLNKNKSKVFLPETVTCAAPPALIGRSVMSLTQSEIKMVS
ncbi:uncharacterized protein [Eucyclogobius newberryi]|uniref:uncharacterized protein isoform X3 n=1 Tax=Eucyclogobius newberryi TaxID=166745 RepID=UPI003B5C07BA